jgi:DNA processing protein
MKNKCCQLTDYQLLVLSLIRGVGRRTLLEIVRFIQFVPSNIEELYEALKEHVQDIPRFRVPEIETIIDAENRAKNLLAKAQKEEIDILGYGNPKFPEALRVIPDPPVLLYSKGNLKAVNNKTCVAVIGTREPSEYGQLMAERVGSYLARKGIAVISGLALGCDSAGHKGCLKEGGYTLAVLANGLDKIYPASNRELGEKILESGGCFLSEYPPGMAPRRNFFVERDRLQSGLSAGVIVAETAVKGGSMHTAHFAISQRKKLACLKHPKKYEGHQKSKGNDALIAERKAFPISTEEDLLSFLATLEGTHKEKESGDRNGDSSNEIENIPTNNVKKPTQIPMFKD